MTLMILTFSIMMNAFPKDFTVTYNYVSGTVGPPYHFEYSVNIDSEGNGTIKYKPDFVFDTIWTETFHLKRKFVKKFWSLLKRKMFFDNEWTDLEKHPVGGSIEYLEINANNKPYKIPAFPTDKEKAEEIYSAVKKLIPESIMDTLTAKKEKYIENFKAE